MPPIQNYLDAYLQRGFGSMTKKDFEVFIMHQLLQGKLKGKSNYEISRELRISEARVKNLIYEVSLKYDTNEEAQRERLMSLLKTVHIYSEGSNFMFIVEDIATRKYLSSLLKTKGKGMNHLLNSEFVELKHEDFIEVLTEMFTEEEKQKISKLATLKLDGNEGPKNNKDFKDHMKDIIDRILEKGKDKIADLTVEGIIKFLAKIAFAAIS
ncbi:MAG: hypothetical protein J6S02_01990 [Bacteroidaceae bacterium]|nr:hypothetical protein [Bacteroidaceae bacterium]